MTATSHQAATARTRLLCCAAAGVLAGFGALAAGWAERAPLLAWIVAALGYVGSVLVSVLRYDAATTKRHALAENPGRAAADVLLLVTSVVSLAAVGVLIFHASQAEGAAKLLDIGLGLGSVVVSWAVVHTLFMLNYARQYYGDPEGGVGFNQSEQPRYADFAYLAFTVGMTFQVSDTDIQSRSIRASILRHALLSYVFGTVIIATTINAVVTLSSSK